MPIFGHSRTTGRGRRLSDSHATTNLLADADIEASHDTADANKTYGAILSDNESGSSSSTSEGAAPSQDAQAGVRKIEAVTLTWTKRSLISLLINIWFIYLANGLRESILAALTPYVTSDFQSHSLLAVVTIVTDSMTAAVYIPMAKLLDVWGRAEGFFLMVCSATMGVVLMATSRSLATFCAAQVFYSVGFAGITYSVDVLAADSTSLQNRGLAFAFTSSPYMITAFAGSKAAEFFLKHISWRWAFGSFAIIVPCVTLPLFSLLTSNLRKAEERGIYQRPSKEPVSLDLVRKQIIAFDLPGVFLFAGGLTIFLLPFTLAKAAPHGWQTGYVIAMIVIGLIMLVSFVLYELYLAPEPFLKHKFLTDRTIIAACLVDATYMISYYCWNSYFTSFLQVVCDLTVAQAGYVNSTFSVVSGFVLFGVGFLIRKTGRFKWLLWLTLPLYMVGLGLMMHFRQPNQPIGYIVMCEVFISFSGSVFVLLLQMAVLAAVDHQFVAAALALLFVAGSIGGAIGSTISGAIWTNTFPRALERYLPESALPNITDIYTSLPNQLSYPVGSPERIAIQLSYGYGQTRMLAAGVGIFSLCFIWVAMMKDLDVSKKGRQTKGVVF